MGFSSLIDILGSITIGGMLFLILFKLNDNAIENNYMYCGEVMVQENLVSVVTLLEHDFRKIGYCSNWEKIPDPSAAILLADSTEIKFLTDVDKDANIDTMHYYLGTTNELSATPNPNDRPMYRVVNNATPVGVNLGVTEFSLTYFDALGNLITSPVTVPGQIYTMQINIMVQDISGYDQQYASSFWRQIRLVARNLRNR